MIPKQKITIYDLAKRLNTTPSTISRALKDHPRISKKMKEAVRGLARELNFHPDPVAHHLRTGRGLVIGVIVPRIDRHFFASVIGGIQSVAQSHGYSVIISQSNESYDKEVEAIKAMLNKKVDGIIISIASETEDYKHLSQMMERVPVIFFDRIPDLPDIDYVINDNFMMGYKAVEHLAARGYKRVVHFAGPQSLLEYRERLAGYKQAVNDLKLEFHDEYIFYNTITMPTGIDAARRILEFSEMPDAIFAAGDYPAITAIDTLKKAGYRIPEDYGVVGVANEPFVNYFSPSLTSFELFNKTMGENAAELLMNKLDAEKDNDTCQTIIIKPELIERESTLKSI